MFDEIVLKTSPDFFNIFFLIIELLAKINGYLVLKEKLFFFFNNIFLSYLDTKFKNSDLVLASVLKTPNILLVTVADSDFFIPLVVMH